MNEQGKLLPDSLLWSYSYDPESGIPGTVRINIPDSHSPFDLRRGLSITVSTSPDIPSVRDLPCYRDWNK